jgi:hypothetical protein
MQRPPGFLRGRFVLHPPYLRCAIKTDNGAQYPMSIHSNSAVIATPATLQGVEADVRELTR